MQARDGGVPIQSSTAVITVTVRVGKLVLTWKVSSKENEAASCAIHLMHEIIKTEVKFCTRAAKHSFSSIVNFIMS